MKKYSEFTDKESEEIHKLLLREPDENMTLLAKRVLGASDSKSLPIAYELVLLDKTPQQILHELIDFYCENSVIQYDLHIQKSLKQKSKKVSSTKKRKTT